MVSRTKCLSSNDIIYLSIWVSSILCNEYNIILINNEIAKININRESKGHFRGIDIDQQKCKFSISS